MRTDNGPRCNHGFPLAAAPFPKYGEGWQQNYARGCKRCGDDPVGCPFKFHGYPEAKAAEEQPQKEESDDDREEDARVDDHQQASGELPEPDGPVQDPDVSE